MKDKEKIFKLLRESAETPQESLAVEEMIRKLEGDMLPIETVSDTQKKCYGFTFYKNNHGRWVGSIGMHRFVWAYFNGEIPGGYEIHHRDFNKENNDISNLELLTEAEHRKIHAEHKKNRAVPQNATFVCAFCGKEFKAVNRGNNTYCSSQCRKKANYAQDKVERICLVCGKVFWSEKHRNARFCSRKCIGKANEKQEIRICPQCGKEFSTFAASVRKYCSMKCSRKSRKKSEIRECLKCGKTFSVCVNSTKKFCSPECFYSSRRKTKICPVCGKEFTVKISTDKRYCSRQCSVAAKRKK